MAHRKWPRPRCAPRDSPLFLAPALVLATVAGCGHKRTVDAAGLRDPGPGGRRPRPCDRPGCPAGTVTDRARLVRAVPGPQRLGPVGRATPTR